MSDGDRSGVVYVILSHRNWDQVRRLAGAILASGPRARVVIAHDQRAERFPTTAGDPRITIRPHHRRSDWGSWDLVAATVDTMRWVRARFDPALVAIVSGEDYPVRPLQDWEADVLAEGGWVGSAEPLRYTPHWGRRLGTGDDRYTRYAYRWYRTPFPRLESRMPPALQRMRSAVALRAEPMVGLRFVTRGRGVHYGVRRIQSPARRRPYYFGSQWLAVCRDALDHLLDEAMYPRSRLERLYRRTVIPDESALVTPLSWWRPPRRLPPVTHVRWSAALDRPVTWIAADLPELVASGSPFCRKVDPEASAGLMDSLDAITSPGP